jgi:hypothetical protein
MKKALKYTFWTLGIIILLFFILFMALSILIQKPKFQTWAVQKSSALLSEKFGSKVSVGSVDIKFIKNIELNKIYLEDKNKDTLLYANKINAEFLLGENFIEQVKNLKNKKIYVGDVALDGIVFYGYRTENDSLFNFSNILDALKSKEKKPAKKQKQVIDIKIDKVKLTNIHLLFDDQYNDQGYELYAKKIDIDMDKLDLKNKIIYANTIDLDAPDFRLKLYNKKEKVDDGIPNKAFAPQNMGIFIQANEIKMNNGRYAMDMLNRKEIKVGQMQISKMRVENINLKIQDYNWDTTGMHVYLKNINTTMSNGIKINDISGYALLDNSQISLQKANIHYNSSKIKGNFALRFLNDWHALSDFENNVVMVADIEKAEVYRKDIVQLVPSIQKYLPEKTNLVADLRGTLNNIKANKIAIQTGNNTKIDITGNIKGLPKINQTLFDLYVNNLQTSASDLKNIVPFIKIPKQVENAGNIIFKGTYKGYINDFYTKGILQTDNLGILDADVHLKFPKGKLPSYDGKVVAKSLNLAELTGNNKLLGTVDVDVNASGNGFDIKNINTKLIGKVRNFYFNGFVFKQIDINGFLDKKKFSGRAFYDDSCFLFDFNGIADFNEKIPFYDFKLNVKNANLHELNLSKDSITVSFNGKVNAHGNKIDNINGFAKLNDIIIQNKKNILTLSDLDADIRSEQDFKHYIIHSNEVDIDVKGNFNPLTIVPSTKVYLKNYSKLIQPTSKDYLKNEAQDFTAKINLRSDFGVLFRVFLPSLSYISDFKINADFNNNADYINLVVNADSLNYSKVAFSNIRLESYNKEKELLSEFMVKNIGIGKTILDDIYIDVNSSLEQLLTSISVEPPSSKNGVQMVSTLDFFGDTLTAKIIDSRLKLNNKIWEIQKGNMITVYDSIFETHNFKLVQDQQEVFLKNGRNTLSDLTLSIKNIELADFAQVIDSTGAIKSGTISGNVNLKNVLQKMQANTDLVINNLKVLDYNIRFIGLDAVYGRNQKNIAEFGGVIDDNDYQLNFNGSYDMQLKGKEKLEVDAIIEKLNLSFLQSILKNEISVKNAFVKGNINASGNLKKIILDGNAKFIDTATIVMKYLGSTFNIPSGESVYLDKDGFDFKQLSVFDDIGNNATIKGRLLHNSFKDFVVEKVFFNAPNGYHFLNTTYDDNQDFYGQVFANGNATINGPFEDLKIDVNAKTLANTVFNLPVSNTSSKENYTYIIFFDPKDITQKVQEKIKLKGISIDMQIEATPDAEVNIILDQSTNDKISGRGSGDLTLNLDKKGKLELNGKYTLTKGNYNFKFQNIISKNFVVKSGSNITFSGDPMSALLDINASYNVNASLRNIVDSNSTLYNRSIPVDLNLLITNTLAQPEINFFVGSSNTSLEAQSDELRQALDRINNNKNEVYNQAFGLLLFNSFMPTQTALSGDQQFTGISNSFTQFFTQQLSTLLTKGLQQAGLKGASLDLLLKDIESKESRQFGFSYKQELFNSRLIFSVGGNVNFGTGTNTNINNLNSSNNSTFTSDFLLEYLITADGRVRLKTFAKTGNFDIINQDRVRTGGAIAFQKDFDSMRELFRINKNPKTKKKEAK